MTKLLPLYLALALSAGTLDKPAPKSAKKKDPLSPKTIKERAKKSRYKAAKKAIIKRRRFLKIQNKLKMQRKISIKDCRRFVNKEVFPDLPVKYQEYIKQFEDVLYGKPEYTFDDMKFS